MDYKRCHIKQYFKERRALRTETTFNDTYDFGVARGLSNFAYLRTLGLRINTRVLHLERTAHDCGMSHALLTRLTAPGRTANGQPAPASSWVTLASPPCWRPCACSRSRLKALPTNYLRPLVAELLGVDEPITTSSMGYDLRRLKRKALIRQVPG